MCYNKIHNCKYCNTLYPCSMDDVACPTLNDDMDANMCDLCRKKLEMKLRDIDELPEIKDILLEDE